MIPVLLRTIQEDGADAGRRLINLILTALLAVFALVVLIGELFTPAFVSYLLAPGFDAPTSRLTVALTRVMLLQPLILAVGSVATAVLNSRNQFVLTALSVASHNVALIAGILAAQLFPDLGIYGPTLGVVGGGILQVLILLPGLLGRRPDERKGAARLRLVFDLADRRLREVTRLLIPNGLSVGVNYAGFILDTAFASKAAEIAGLPAIQNAWLLGQAVGQSSFPRLAAHAAAAEWRPMRRTLLRSLGAVVALALPALLGLVLLGRAVIHILFERGKFDAAAGALTYQVLVAYAVALPLYVDTEVITRGLIALGDTRTPLLTNTAQIAGRALLLSLLIAPLGVLAIPIAFAVTASIETLLLGTVLLLKLRRLSSDAA
jgi:putative peptidoglycan lipid II flippase